MNQRTHIHYSSAMSVNPFAGGSVYTGMASGTASTALGYESTAKCNHFAHAPKPEPLIGNSKPREWDHKSGKKVLKRQVLDTGKL